MTKMIGYSLCGLLVVSGAVAHGLATHRWSALTPNQGRSEAMHQVVVRLGDYESKQVESDLPPNERSRVTCRQYTSAAGRLPAATVSITSGPPGAVSTHTPDVCYPGSGFKTVREPKLETIDLPDGTKATYLVADFEKKTTTTFERQRVRWAWTAKGGWGVPDRPRFAFLLEPELFKLYVVTSIASDDPDQPAADSPAVKAFVTAAFAQHAAAMTAR